MLLMSLDHTRDFFSAAHFDPTDLSRTTGALFLTRWITHFCAPVFILLAGAAAFLSTRQGLSTSSLRRFLVGRGLWIILLGLTLESLVWTPRPDFSLLAGAVLWAIGWSMLTLALLVDLRPTTIGVLGLLVIGGHNAFDGVEARSLGAYAPLWSILHTRESIHLTPTLSLEPYYPLIPWIGVMAAGYGFGQILLHEPVARRDQLVRLGTLLSVLFIALRWSNLYGDPTSWTLQRTATFTVLAFVNCEKYPPSLLYLLMTLGPALLALAWLDRARGPLMEFLAAFGRVPLFFYIVHLLYIVVLALLIKAWQDGDWPNYLERPFAADAYGYSLPLVYLVWFGVVLSLYPLCRAFADFKSRHRHWRWLRFL
jgi:uncharacterized membrane protein